MSDEKAAEIPESERDTLPMGQDVAKNHLLDTIVDADWEQVPAAQRDEGGPAEVYRCEVDGIKLRFERDGRMWQGHLSADGGDVSRETRASENIGKVARALKRILADVRGA